MRATRRILLLGGAASLIAHKSRAQIVQAKRLANSGFTQVVATADGGGPVPGGVVPLLQQGIRYNGNGSRVLYVSSSAGSDRNTGTQAAPFATKAAALAHMRNGYPDQMLCKSGDVWPVNDVITINMSGAGPGIIGQGCTGPLLFGFYGNGTRPLHQVSEKSQSNSIVTIGTKSNPCNYIAIIGWEFYPPTMDPLATTYTTAGPNSGLTAINVTSGLGGGSGNGIPVGPSWLLVEDCRFSYIGTSTAGISNSLTTNNVTPSGSNVLNFASVPSWLVPGTMVFPQFGGISIPSGTTVLSTTNTTVTLSANVLGSGVLSGTNIGFGGLLGTIAFRRCLAYCSYNFGGGNNYGGHSSIFFWSSVYLPIMDECAVAYGGWNPTLSAAQTVTANGGILTWPIDNYAFNALPFPNNATIFVEDPSADSGLSGRASYNVVNANANGPGTFGLSATKDGSPITVANGTYRMMWADPSLNMFNHTIYLDDTCAQNNAQVTNNIALYSTNVMVRIGGTITGNYVAYHSALGFYIGVQNNETGPGFVAPIFTHLNMSGNVVQHPGNTVCANQFSTADAAGVGVDLENCDGSGGSINCYNNIFSMSATMSPTKAGIVNFCNVGQNDFVSNVKVTNNIFYKWNDQNSHNDLGYTGVFNNNGNRGTGLVVSPNAIDLAGSNTNRYPDPLRDLASYDRHVLGGPGTAANAIDQIIGTGPAVVEGVSQGLGRSLQTWPTSLSATGVVSYIQEGFGNPF